MAAERETPLVAVVEDEPDLYEVVFVLFESWGYTGVGLVDGEEALAQLPTLLPDLILLDIRLPGAVSGLDVLKALRAAPLTATIPIVVMTAYHWPDAAAECMQLGATDFMFKPLPRAAELKARLDTHMHWLQLQRAAAAAIMPGPVFISYTRRDWASAVQPLVARLQAAGIPIWIDQHLIEGSDDWMDEINAALKACSAVLLCASPDALASRYVKMEYRYAFNNGKRLYPLLLRPCDLPAELQVIHHYTAAQIDNLVEAIKRNL